ncbi:MAG: CHAT domain-containing protein [Cyanobacteria bacterium P01_F01_bin.143]
MNKLPRKILFVFTIITSFLLVLGSKIVLSNEHQTVASLEQEAKNLYQENNFSQAIIVLERAIENYQAQGDLVGSAIANRNLALIHQQLGNWSEAETSLAQAEDIIATIDNQATSSQLLAQVLEVRGQIQLSLGQTENALETWKEATKLYEQQENSLGFLQTKIYQVHALKTLGLYSQSMKVLTDVSEQLENEPDTTIKVQALLNLGKVYTRVGQYEKAADILDSSFAIAESLGAESLIAEILLSSGNNARLQSEPQKALDFYQQAIAQFPLSDIQLRGKLNRLDVLISLEEIANAQQEVAQIQQLLAQLPPRQSTIQAQVSLARYLIQLETNPRQVSELLLGTIKQAKSLNIKRLESDALGVLGNLYEKNQQWQEAEKITERALIISQGINAKELTYQWQWQLGRILSGQGNRQQAITAYTQATNNLQALRSDLVAISSDVQYSFREKIEPVYRELAALLLEPGASQEDLNQAREIIDSLQVAQLDNFFRDACLDTQPVQVEQIDPQAAIFYTIIIGDRLEVIAAIPDQPLQHYTQNLPASEIEIVISSASSQISNPRRLNLRPLQRAYDWLIRPLEDELEASEIKTLVFIPDGILRNLPPATLHDGEQYLIEKYSIAIAPSLQLVELQAQEETNQELLLAGLSESRQEFPSLPGVKQEIEQIQDLFTSQVLLDEGFTELNFNRAVSRNPFKLVHLATHGQFSSTPEETFILTWDERINIDELSRLLRGDSKQLNPVDLLVLSACETASGDRDSALGLAGIAVRGGAQSTIASLWSVSDKATVDLMTNLYQELIKSDTTKAEALRRAQIALLNTEEFSDPFFWSAFILVGNWQ